MNKTDEILEAEGRYDLSDECEEFFRQSIQDAENSRFSGLCASNTTRWNSDSKMGKSYLKNKGVQCAMRIDLRVCIWNFRLIFYFFTRLITDIIKRCLEITGNYDLILNEDDWELLTRYVEILKVFEVFTVHVQARNYPTMNSMILFRSEIVDR